MAKDSRLEKVCSAVRKIDIDELSTEELVEKLSILDDWYIKMQQLIVKSASVVFPASSDDPEDFVEKLEHMESIQRLIEYYSTQASEIHAYLKTFSRIIKDRQKMKEVEVAFDDELQERKGLKSKTDIKNYAMYAFKEVHEKRSQIDKFLILWESLDQRFRTRSSDSKSHIKNFTQMKKTFENNPDLLYYKDVMNNVSDSSGNVNQEEFKLEDSKEKKLNDLFEEIEEESEKG